MLSLPNEGAKVPDPVEFTGDIDMDGLFASLDQYPRLDDLSTPLDTIGDFSHLFTSLNGQTDSLYDVFETTSLLKSNLDQTADPPVCF